HRNLLHQSGSIDDREARRIADQRRAGDPRSRSGVRARASGGRRRRRAAHAAGESVVSRRLSPRLASLAVSWLGFSARADAPVRAKPPASASATGRAEAEGVVNLNEASADELELLPGIGPAKARSIVEH